MRKSTLLAQIARKKADKDAIAGRVVRQPELLPEVYKGLSSDKAEIKYGCLKVLRVISERKPAILYPSIDFFIGLLDCDNNFLKWGASLSLPIWRRWIPRRGLSGFWTDTCDRFAVAS